jgi:DNA-binding CsgD family transcriptional regulator
MHDYAAPAKLALPVTDAELVRRYEAGKSCTQIADNLGCSCQTISRRLKASGVELRSPRAASNYNERQTRETSDLWAAGLSAQEIADGLRVRPSTVYRRLKLAGWTAESKRLREMYVEKRLPIAVIGSRLHMSPSTVSAKLKALGIALRSPAGKVRQPIAPMPSVRPVFIAASVRRLNGLSEISLTPKQRDLLDIVRAAPEPIETGAIRDVARDLPRSWRSLSVGNIGACLKRMQPHGLVDRVRGVHKGIRFRGNPCFLRLPVSQEIARPDSMDDALRLREIQVLIAHQRQDEQFGHRVKPTGAASLDAPISGDGFTILATLGDEDEALAELVGEAA